MNAVPSSPSHGDSRRYGVRLTLGAVVPLIVLVVAYVPYVVARSELPARLATHFDASGRPDQSMTQAGLLGTTGVLIGIGLLVCAALALSKGLTAQVAAAGGFLGGFLAALGAGLLVSTVLSQRGLATWSDARLSWWMLVIVLTLALAAGTVTARLATSNAIEDQEPSSGDRPVMILRAEEHAVWSSSTRSTILLVVGVASAAVGLTIGWVVDAWFEAIAVGFTGLITLNLATVRVRADRNGLHLRYGWLPLPRTTIRVERVRVASVIEVNPSEWGGWGYRGSLTLMKRAAVVLRAGPGIRLDLLDGKVFVVTVDNPHDGVALLNAEAQRAR